MAAVDISVPEGIPHSGLLTSDQGMLRIGEYDIIKVSRATLRIMNNIGVYRETGKRTGTTYAGNQRVTGQITRAFLNMAEHRLGLGVEAGTVIGTETFYHGPGVLTTAQIAALLTEKTKSFPLHNANNTNFYPLRCDVALDININQLPIVTTEEQDTIVTTLPKIQTIVCKNALITNMVIAYDSRGIITSGPLDFIGSAIRWSANA